MCPYDFQIKKFQLFQCHILSNHKLLGKTQNVEEEAKIKRFYIRTKANNFLN